MYSISTIVDTSIEDYWECRCAVPRYGSISTFELPVCNEEFIDIMDEFRDLFNFGLYPNDIPIRTPPRMIPQAYKSEVDIQIQDMLDRNIIRVSNSPWLSPPVIVGKKDGGIRFFALIIVV